MINQWLAGNRLEPISFDRLLTIRVPCSLCAGIHSSFSIALVLSAMPSPYLASPTRFRRSSSFPSSSISSSTSSSLSSSFFPSFPYLCSICQDFIYPLIQPPLYHLLRRNLPKSPCQLLSRSMVLPQNQRARKKQDWSSASMALEISTMETHQIRIS